MGGNASPLEWAWVLIAALSFAASLVDTVRAVAEVCIHRRDTGPERGISVSSLLKSVVLLAMTVLGLGIGAVAVRTPNGVRESVQDYQVVVAYGLIAYESLLAVVIVIKDWERWYVAQWVWVARKRAPEEKGARQ